MCNERLVDGLRHRGVRRVVLAADRGLRSADGRQMMNGIEIIALFLSAGLFFYLTVALVKPEWFE
jgi:K+-transporting ATPase KdpF subunit